MWNWPTTSYWTHCQSLLSLPPYPQLPPHSCFFFLIFRKEEGCFVYLCLWKSKQTQIKQIWSQIVICECGLTAFFSTDSPSQTYKIKWVFLCLFLTLDVILGYRRNFLYHFFSFFLIWLWVSSPRSTALREATGVFSSCFRCSSCTEGSAFVHCLQSPEDPHPFLCLYSVSLQLGWIGSLGWYLFDLFIDICRF